jgi:hypothetical protein
MKSFIATLAVACAVLVGAAAVSHAMPVAPLASRDSAVIKVIEGCGPYGHRGPYGACRPRYSCPAGWHPGPYGWHCFRN